VKRWQKQLRGALARDPQALRGNAASLEVKLNQDAAIAARFWPVLRELCRPSLASKRAQ
jgi:hypothetical protein